MEQLLKPPKEHKSRGPMTQNNFYMAMVTGMVAIVLILGFNAYGTWTAVECTSVYYTAEQGNFVGTVGNVHHSCFDRSGNIIEVLDDFEKSIEQSVDETVTVDPRFPPLEE